VADFVEQSEATVVGVHAPGVVGNGAGVRGPHKISSGDEGLVIEMLEKFQVAHPPECWFFYYRPDGFFQCRA